MAQPTSTGCGMVSATATGKSEAKSGAMAEAALDGDLAAQRFDEPAHQRQAHAGAAL